MKANLMWRARALAVFGALCLSACGAAQPATPTIAPTPVPTLPPQPTAVPPTVAPPTLAPTVVATKPPPTATPMPAMDHTAMPPATATAQPVAPTPTRPSPTATAAATTVPKPPAPGAVVQANITLFSFQPGTIEVAVGTTVVWTNNDFIEHSVTSGKPDAPDGVFDSGFFLRGKTFSYTFTKPGTYAYFCRRHNSMFGEVVVR